MSRALPREVLPDAPPPGEHALHPSLKQKSTCGLNPHSDEAHLIKQLTAQSPQL
eukprot:m.177990 g.177990  ORF g.177990 m.177990 type:complete len:54 (-) comp14919_c0_seq2:91-252(-)